MFKKILYFLGLALFGIFLFLILKNADLTAFVDTIENRSFDLRQSILINQNTKKHNEDIVIIAIDDASYEYILDNYGEWPLPRDMYAKIIEFLEPQQPKIIAFDLMFVKSMKSENDADNALIQAFKKYNNIFASMNFDNQPEELRTPPILPDKLSLGIKNYSDIDFSELTFTNCRTILEGIINATNNIGIINVSRSDDGILRKMPLVVKYQDKFYPQLALTAGIKYIKDTENQTIKDIEINKNHFAKIGSREIFLDGDGSAILNWYGPAGTYTYIPVYQLITTINGKTKLNYDFKDKIVYFGTTAASLFDIKTVPAGKVYPGVEVQATYINNIIDNNFINKINRFTTILISIILAIFIAVSVVKLNSVFEASVISVSLYFLYILVSYYLMLFCNIWLEIIYPLIFSILSFTLTIVIKYLIKSRDFETQYKLATTDGLTELYNHRYFQEQMLMQVEQAKRYNNNFSLIIIDIDYFKKFNDTFGHQSGDAVLRQVAFTLKKNVRSTDIVCRYGGEEMSIILPNIGKEEVVLTAQKICKRISEKKFKLYGDRESTVTISLGVATYPYDGEDASTLISVADKRLYQAKNNGRNQVGW